MSNDSKVVKFQ